jgi:hypothetical protein
MGEGLLNLQKGLIVESVELWLKTTFENRHQQRSNEVGEVEKVRVFGLGREFRSYFPRSSGDTSARLSDRPGGIEPNPPIKFGDLRSLLKQHMAAIRMLFSWLTEKGVLGSK